MTAKTMVILKNIAPTRQDVFVAEMNIHPPIASKPGICRPSVSFVRETIPRITKVVKYTKVSNSFVNPPQKKIVTIQIMLIMLITLILKPLISILPILIHHQTLPNHTHKPPPQIILPKHQTVL